MPTFEVALDRNGWIFPYFPCALEESVSGLELGEYFFFNDNLNIMVEATDADDAITVARAKAEALQAAGKWGIDNVGTTEGE